MENDVLDVLLGMRKELYAFSADVKEMYLQVRMKDEDQPYHRVLWRNEKEQLEALQFRVFPFGSTCSPAAAMFVVR